MANIYLTHIVLCAILAIAVTGLLSVVVRSGGAASGDRSTNVFVAPSGFVDDIFPGIVKGNSVDVLDFSEKVESLLQFLHVLPKWSVGAQNVAVDIPYLFRAVRLPSM